MAVDEIPIAVVEDDDRYRESLERLLHHAPGMRLAASFPRLQPALAAAPTARWSLVLMDLELPDGSGIDAIRHLKATRPELSLIALTVFEEPATILQTICAGADGYLLKRASVAELLGGIRAVLAGGSPLTPTIARSLLELVRRTGGTPAPPLAPRPPSRLDLTEREQAVLRALSSGCSYKEVADQLAISLDTVRSHVRALYRKLQVHSVSEAISRAIREGMV